MPRIPLLLTGLLLVLATALCALTQGAAGLSATQLLSVLGWGAPADDWVRGVVLDVRLPRVLLALAIGAALAPCGAVLQALFRNPLAEPSLLGISGGAALAVAGWLAWAPAGLAIAASLALPAVATAGALLAALLVIRFAQADGLTDIPTLLLAGLAVNALAGAGIALLQALVTDAALRDITVWLYGSLGRADWTQLAVGLPLLVGIALLLPRRAAALDALLLGEAEAAHLGLEVERLKRELLLAVVIATATAVALAGIVGFVGLIVPHLVRRLAGPGHRLLLPASAVFGALLVVVADTAARTLFAPMEIPVGVLTALAGAPLFLLLLRRPAAPG